MEDILLDKIKSGELKHKGQFNVGLKQDEDGYLSLGFNVAKRNVENYYLVLINSKDAGDKIIMPGVQREKDVLFDFTDCDKLFLDADITWLCYIAFDNEGKVTYKRLINKTGGEDIEDIAENNDGVTLCRADLYIQTIIRHEINGKEYEFYLNKNIRRDTISLRAIRSKFVYTIKEDVLFHKSKAKKPDTQFAFSIVTAVYNVQDYLEETIESIISQDIGFEENVQLILVDDGSKDESPAICDKYAQMYPNNIIAIHKSNGGVASARNEGKKHATGRYVNFCDSDDKFSENVLSTVKSFFDKHYNEIDVVSIPIYFFDGEEGPHWQNYKFKNGTRVADLWKDYNITSMFVTASFFKNELTQKFEYDPTLPSGEDTKFIAQILLEKMAIGLVTECNFWYRRRSEGGSLINTLRTKKSYYFEYFENLVFFLFEYSKEKYGFAPYFVQNTIMTDLQWRFRIKDYSEAGLNDSEIALYESNMIKALNLIDDTVIERQMKLSRDQKIQLYSLKYGNKITIRQTANDIDILQDNIYLASISNMLTKIDFIGVKDDYISIEGYVVLMGVSLDAELDIYVKCIDDYYVCEKIERVSDCDNCFGNLKQEIGFRGRIPVKEEYYERRIKVAIAVNGLLVERTLYRYGKFSPINLEKKQYYINGENKLSAKKDCIYLEKSCAQEEHIIPFNMDENDENNLINLCRFTDEEKKTRQDLVYEEEYLYSLYKGITYVSTIDRPITNGMLTDIKFEKIAKIRRFAKLYEKKKPIWLISDRMNVSDDNGEAFFRYLMSREDLPVDAYFVIKEDSPDYEKMCGIGPVLAYGSDEHLCMHVVADCIISSQAEDSVFTPFEGEKEYYGDRKYYADLLAEQKFIFLQHGVTKDDLSKWLSRYNKNIFGFITTAYRESNSILEYPYSYDEENVWLTGFPRFDYMYNEPQNQIVLCPTWRAYLQNLSLDKFALTDYYKFYKELICNKKLNKIIDKYNYRFVIKMHPRMREYMSLFENLGVLTILDDDVTYRQIFAESKLMITDYSSTAMDFAYIDKPVVYYQFDKDEFFGGGHMYTAGYFNYENDGFGPVATDAGKAAEEIIKIIKNDCKVEEKYAKRRKDFFLERDGKNCERVYNKILQNM